MQAVHDDLKILGVLNVTPDSFSDGDRYPTLETQVARAQELRDLGADVIDVGGESTRPGATLISDAEELRRVVPVVRALASAGLTISVDTIRAATAEAAVLAGARYVNDVSGGLFDPEMIDTVARLTANIDDVYYIIGHWRGIPDPHQSRSDYADVVTEVRDALQLQIDASLEAGIPADRIILDPGLGFDKTPEQGWEILRRIHEIEALGYPVLIGVSRKRMLASVPGPDTPVTDRDLATSVVTALSAQAGAWGVRVHDVEGSRQALSVAQLWGKPAPHGGAVPERVPTPEEQRMTITLTGVEAYAYHGVFPEERDNGQPFIIDLSVETSAQNIGDEIDHTVHYGELAEQVVAAVQADPVDLIETLAERVLGVAFTFSRVLAATVTIHKPKAPITVPFQDVSVTLTRTNTEQAALLARGRAR